MLIAKVKEIISNALRAGLEKLTTIKKSLVTETATATIKDLRKLINFNNAFLNEMIKVSQEFNLNDKGPAELKDDLEEKAKEIEAKITQLLKENIISNLQTFQNAYQTSGTGS